MPFGDETFNGVFINGSLHERSHQQNLRRDKQMFEAWRQIFDNDVPRHESVCEVVQVNE
jgi:hypothetical protein